jgi:hypothetical protein
MVDLTHDLRKLTAASSPARARGPAVTNRALYDQFVGTMARANSMLTKFENPNGTVAHLLDDPTLYNRFVTLIGRRTLSFSR